MDMYRCQVCGYRRTRRAWTGAANSAAEIELLVEADAKVAPPSTSVQLPSASWTLTFRVLTYWR